jgi:hypothetical protein
MAALSDRTYLPEEKQTIKSLEVLLKSEFFAVMKQACGKSVEKYWLTGVLPAFRDGISPLTSTTIISFHERYQSLCGFTQGDVKAIITRALRDFPGIDPVHTLNSIKRWYNGYLFSPTSSGSEDLTLYNPQLVFVHLYNTLSGPAPTSYIDEANAVHTSTILSVVGENGPVTIHNLIDMAFSKATVRARILSELSFAELMKEEILRTEDVTWSLLYYLGIVTFYKDSDCPKGTDSLRAPNVTMVRLVSPRMACLEEC